MIVAHHYVINFGLIDAFVTGIATRTSMNYLFLSLWGMWGKYLIEKPVFKHFDSFDKVLGMVGNSMMNIYCSIYSSIITFIER